MRSSIKQMFGGIAAGALLLLGSVSPAAGAESSTDTETFTSEAATITVVTQPDAATDAQLSSLAATFTCSLKVNNPHGSTHVAGTINVVSTVNCQINAARIRLATDLYRLSPYGKWVGTPKVVTNKNTVSSNAAAPCSAGPAEFTGRAVGTITAPPGYQLSGSPTLNMDGPQLGVACGTRRMAPITGDTGIETVEFTFIRTDLAGEE